jgi:hypothetical protein
LLAYLFFDRNQKSDLMRKVTASGRLNIQIYIAPFFCIINPTAEQKNLSQWPEYLPGRLFNRIDFQGS